MNTTRETAQQLTREAHAQRPLRRDAERNRQRILDAARTLVAEQGLGVSHDQLAESADVAVGTVYRRFPDKESLIEALYAEQVEEVVASARRALDIADPWQALVTFMTEGMSICAGNRGLKELALGCAQSHALACQAQDQIAPIIDELVRRAHAAGILRPGVGTQDFTLLALMVGSIIDSAWCVDQDLWRRPLAIALDGFRSRYCDPLPGAAPDREQAGQVRSGWAPTHDRHRHGPH